MSFSSRVLFINRVKLLQSTKLFLICHCLPPAKLTMSPHQGPNLIFPMVNLVGLLGQQQCNAVPVKIDHVTLPYKGIMSPSKDPILTAFELSWELRQLAFSEFEFKSEYLVRNPLLGENCCYSWWDFDKLSFVPGIPAFFCSQFSFGVWREFDILIFALLLCKRGQKKSVNPSPRLHNSPHLPFSFFSSNPAFCYFPLCFWWQKIAQILLPSETENYSNSHSLWNSLRKFYNVYRKAVLQFPFPTQFYN